MTKLFFTSLLICFVYVCSGQIRPLVFEEYKQGLNPVDEIPIFNASEIKGRKIDTAFIIYHPGSWSEEEFGGKPCSCTYADTLSMYVFDKEGRTIEYSSFYLQKKTFTMHFDSLGRRTRINHSPSDTNNFKVAYIREKHNNDSLITTISFWKFSHGLDTAVIETKRFDSKGRMIEEKSRISRRNRVEIDDDTGEYSYHYKYNYDEHGRLIYYHEFGISEEYHIITYPFYGKLTEVYDGKTNKLKDRRMKWIKEVDGITTVTFDRKQITLVPLEKGSKLVKIICIAQSADNAYLNFHEVSYK